MHGSHFEAEILDTGAVPIYQQIAPKSYQLKQLGLSNSSIARRLGFTDKTVTKAVAWLRLIEHRSIRGGLERLRGKTPFIELESPWENKGCRI